jgi:TetR/AcrR family transcriptional regulator, transcriptional repressor for nem operon
VARSKEFDPKEAVKTATLIFRRRGFLGTSIDDLVRETGVSRYGLYSTYTDKKGLFLAALDNFRDDYVTKLLANLENDSSSLKDVYAYFSVVVDSAGTPEGKLSCLMCSSINELSGMDRDIDARLSTHFKRLRNAFHNALTNELKRGELKSSNPECLADYLLGIAHGSASLNRSGASKKVVKTFINTAMSAFNQK